jgi:branched-chain amino acid transport system substrate-binding protein
MKKTVLMAALAASTLLSALPASAQEGIYLPLLTYRTGPFGASGVPIANGMRDYLEMINQRDGGVGGVKLIIDECETGYDTKKGVECYEAVRSKNPVFVNPYSTGIQLQTIAKMPLHKVTMLAMGYGLSAAADGKTFPWVFNPPLTYWDAASVMIQHIAAKEGGIDKLKGMKIGYLHLDAPYGKEPIPFLETMSKKFGFELKLYPVAAAEMQNQSTVWLNIRRDRPDYIYNQGWGAMNPTAIKEAVKASFPMDKFIGNFWAGGDDDARAGEAWTPRATSRWPSTQPGPISGDAGHYEARRRQGPVQGRVQGQGRREPLQSRRLQLDADGRGHPQRAEADRQEDHHR